jgi:hypothetical protein
MLLQFSTLKNGPLSIQCICKNGMGFLEYMFLLGKYHRSAEEIQTILPNVIINELELLYLYLWYSCYLPIDLGHQHRSKPDFLALCLVKVYNQDLCSLLDMCLEVEPPLQQGVWSIFLLVGWSF